MNNDFSRGSEWRKWDLHAHTPLDYAWEDDVDLTDEESKKLSKKPSKRS